MSGLEGLDLSQIPAGTPPPGVIPNFVNPDTKANAVTAVSVVMMTITALMVSARLWSNFSSMRKFYVDDCRSSNFQNLHSTDAIQTFVLSRLSWLSLTLDLFFLVRRTFAIVLTISRPHDKQDVLANRR